LCEHNPGGEDAAALPVHRGHVMVHPRPLRRGALLVAMSADRF